ncbi:Hypothetical predicted protein, partial [Marmota monax]
EIEVRSQRSPEIQEGGGREMEKANQDQGQEVRDDSRMMEEWGGPSNGKVVSVKPLEIQGELTAPSWASNREPCAMRPCALRNFCSGPYPVLNQHSPAAGVLTLLSSLMQAAMLLLPDSTHLPDNGVMKGLDEQHLPSSPGSRDQ